MTETSENEENQTNDRPNKTQTYKLISVVSNGRLVFNIELVVR